MRGRPSCLLQSAGGEANRILLASALSFMRIICPNKVSRHDCIAAVSLGCFVSLRTSSFRNKLVPPDAKQHTQTPLVECINLTCVRALVVLVVYIAHCRETSNALDASVRCESNVFRDCLKLFLPITRIPQSCPAENFRLMGLSHRKPRSGRSSGSSDRNSSRSFLLCSSYTFSRCLAFSALSLWPRFSSQTKSRFC